MELKLTTRAVGDRTIVEVGGEIDVVTAPQLRETLQSLIRQGHHHLVVDLEQVSFLDSTGIGVFNGARIRLQEHEGSLRLVCTHERVLKIFRIIGLLKVFPTFASVAEAVEATD